MQRTRRNYKHNKALRKRHPEKWKESKRRYYSKSKWSARRAGEKWSYHETQLIIASNRPPDSVLARKLGRSIKAILARRIRWKQGNVA